MNFQLFVEKPSLGLKKGIVVREDTEITFESEKASQTLRGLVLETELSDEGTNGINSYRSKSHITIMLNDGDILLFDTVRGYYLPSYPHTTVEEAIEDISSLRGRKLVSDDESEV